MIFQIQNIQSFQISKYTISSEGFSVFPKYVNCKYIHSNPNTILSNCILMLTSVPGELFHVGTCKSTRERENNVFSYRYMVSKCRNAHQGSISIEGSADAHHACDRPVVSFSLCLSAVLLSVQKRMGMGGMRGERGRTPTKTKLYLSYTKRVVEFINFFRFSLLFCILVKLLKK